VECRASGRLYVGWLSAWGWRGAALPPGLAGVFAGEDWPTKQHSSAERLLRGNMDRWGSLLCQEGSFAPGKILIAFQSAAPDP